MWRFAHEPPPLAGVVVLHFRRKSKGACSIRKILTLMSIVSAAVGVVYLAASFFVLRDYRKELDALDERVEDLEYDRLLEAYRREGYEVD